MALASLLTLAEAKAWLRIEGSDDDANVEQAALTATAMVADELDFDPVMGEASERHLGQQTKLLFPRRPRCTAVASVVDEDDNGGTAVPVLFDLRAIRRADGGFWLRDRHYVVTCTAGHDPASAEGLRIKQAARLALQACYGAAFLDPNLSGESQGRAFSGSYTAGGPGSMPAAAQALLRPLKRMF